jgi:hypothetical protein
MVGSRREEVICRRRYTENVSERGEVIGIFRRSIDDYDRPSRRVIFVWSLCCQRRDERPGRSDWDLPQVDQRPQGELSSYLTSMTSLCFPRQPHDIVKSHNTIVIRDVIIGRWGLSGYIFAASDSSAL